MIFHNIFDFVFYKIIFSLHLFFKAGAGFSNIPRKYENVVCIIKNPRNRNKFFQTLNSDHKKGKKYYEI